MNRPWLFVHRRPRIGILSTGDEIVMPGDAIGPHQIVSSNSLSLAAFVAACGGVPISAGNAPHDLVREALAVDGFELDFWQIAMRPGKPLMVGRYRGTPLIGLPGNPVSTVV